MNTQELSNDIRAGNRRALAQAITLVESTRADHRTQAAELLNGLAPVSNTTIRLGVTGAPGVGKSTFIEAIGLHLLNDVHRLAVLSIDPSSALGGGSILGDKTRMEKLSIHSRAFIRPSPSGGALGGVARHTREAIRLCEAAGFDVVIVETVGVGQSEIAVADLVDLFLLLVAPAAGDELQGIKRGIMELADLVIVNKADGELLPAASRTAADYRLALGLLQSRSQKCRPTVELCSALTGAGIAKVWELICIRHQTDLASGALVSRRSVQARQGMWGEVTEKLLTAFQANPEVVKELAAIEVQVAAGQLAPAEAAERLVEKFLTELRNPAGRS